MSSDSEKSEGALVAGQMLGRYELLSPIGRGGMGNVWAARLKGARGFRKLFAVKTILNVNDHPRLEQMLFDEATLASQIQHPNVIETIELGEHEGKLYLVMDLVDGESLSFILRKAVPEGGVPLPIAVNLVGQVCRGLQAAHELTDEHDNRIGLVHRDISPPNVLVTYSGTVKIVDFGVAITAASETRDPNEIKGKVSYFAPEQLRSQPLDERVDVFAAAILLYLLTTNRHPFRSSTESETINRILSSAPVTPPSVFLENYPEALETVLLRALEKERDRRYASAAAFLEALERAYPTAFGPAGDKLVGDYVHQLLKDRMLERRHILRAAEDGAQLSSARASVLSAPAVVTARALSGKSSRSGSLALTGFVLTLAGSALTLRNFASSPEARRAPQVALARPEAPRPASGTVPSLAVAAPRVQEEPESILQKAPFAAPFPNGILPATVAKASPARLETRFELPDEAKALNVPPPQAARVVPKPAGSDGAALAVGSGLGTAAESALAASRRNRLSGSTPKSAQPPKVHQVASKLGHAQLAINPLSEPYRVQLPHALQRSDHNFDATVNICVAPNGSVSSVKFVRSAGPIIDAQLMRSVSRWRYRPLLENEQAVPFCYVLRYQFAGR